MGEEDGSIDASSCFVPYRHARADLKIPETETRKGLKHLYVWGLGLRVCRVFYSKKKYDHSLRNRVYGFRVCRM